MQPNPRYKQYNNITFLILNASITHISKFYGRSLLMFFLFSQVFCYTTACLSINPMHVCLFIVEAAIFLFFEVFVWILKNQLSHIHDLRYHFIKFKQICRSGFLNQPACALLLFRLRLNSLNLFLRPLEKIFFKSLKKAG